MYYRNILNSLALALGILFLAACSSAEYYEDIPRHQPLRIVTATSPLPVATESVKQELINTYTLVYVSPITHRVEAIQNVDKQDEGVEYDVASFPIEISESNATDRHAYKVYAFANFTDEMKAATKFGVNYTLASIRVGTFLEPTYETTLQNTTVDIAALNGHDFSTGDLYIPMTAVVDYDATMQYHQPVNVPLVRLMAKLRFDITSKMQPAINVNSVVITPITNREVYLLPHITRYGTSKNAENLTVLDKTGTKLAPGEYPANPAEDGDYRYIPDLPYSTLDQTTDTVKVNISGNLDLNPNEKKTFGKTYVNESLAKWHPTKHFAVALKFTTDEGAIKEARYALSGDDFTAICRNDEVIIPLTISDEYAIEPEIEFYPPIGGYPAVVDKRSDDEFYVQFGSEGDFAIYADVLKDGKKTGLSISNTEIFDFDKDVDVQIEYLSGDESMFTTVPSYKESDNAFIGTISNTPGHAILTFTVKVKGTNALITKKVHIIRD